MALSPKAKRVLWVVTGGIVGVLLLLVLLRVLFLGLVIRKAVEAAGPRLLGVTTQLEDVSVSLFAGRISLIGLQVSNPQGFSRDTFLKADIVHVAANLASLATKDVHIREIILDGPVFTYERIDGRSNVDALLARLRKKETTQPQPSQPKAQHRESRRFRIDHVRVTNAKVYIVTPGYEMTIPLLEIDLHNLRHDEISGRSLHDVVEQVLDRLIDPIKDASRGSGLPEKAGERLKKD